MDKKALAILLLATTAAAWAAPDAPALANKTTLTGKVVPIDTETVENPYASPPPAPKRELGMIDRWRYDNCTSEATRAPTPVGVNTAMALCREKFGQ